MIVKKVLRNWTKKVNKMYSSFLDKTSIYIRKNLFLATNITYMFFKWQLNSACSSLPNYKIEVLTLFCFPQTWGNKLINKNPLSRSMPVVFVLLMARDKCDLWPRVFGWQDQLLSVLRQLINDDTSENIQSIFTWSGFGW